MSRTKGTPWTTSKVDNLFANLRRLTSCMERISVALGGTETSTPTPTTSYVFTGTIDDTESFGGTVSGDIRAMEFQSDTEGIFAINIVKSDGSNLSFQTFGPGSWSYEGLLPEAPIIEVTVTNITGSAGAVNGIINLVSRS